MGRNLAATGSPPAAGAAEPAPAAVAVATMSLPAELETMVGAALAAWLPRAAVTPAARPETAAQNGADWVIVAPAADGAAALAELRRLRTAGYDGPVLLIAGEGATASAGEGVELTRLGGRRCALGDGFAGRLATVGMLAARDTLTSSATGGGGVGDGEEAGGTEVTALRAELAETRRLLALAEVARRLPHALNNPLAALLAEAQLLELEELAPEQRESTGRIVQLARRVIGLVRELQVAQPRR